MVTESEIDWYGPDTATFGDRLAGARRAVGMTQEELARHLGVELGTLRDWEDDIAEPRANRLATLSGILNVSISWLLTGEGAGPDGSDEADAHPPGLDAALAELRTVRAQLLAAAERIGRLEKRLRETGGFE